MIHAVQITREFRFNGMLLPDIDPNFSPSYIKDFHSNVYPSLTNAQIDDQGIQGDKHVFEFSTKVGIKG